MEKPPALDEEVAEQKEEDLGGPLIGIIHPTHIFPLQVSEET
jgi:hypothetical protein